jgi:polysaccharide chain length determinant protein (PEP-CTERM system associated)
MLPEGADNSLGIAVSGNATDVTITGLQTRRAELLLSVTAKHPDVVAIDEQLEQLYEKRRSELEALRSAGRGIEGAANATNPVYQNAQIALNEASVAIAALRSQITQREEIVRVLNEQITTIPEIEAEYAQLTRDYDQYKSLYNELLLQKERERLGSVGDERDVVSFNVVEPPSSTIEPVAPQRGLLLVVTLLAGLGIGGGVAFLLHQSNPVFCDAETLRRVSMRPVLGVVSKTWLDRRRVQRRVDILTFAAATMGLGLVFMCTLVFQDVGVVILNEILTQPQG